jgi:hypothetical protein
MAFLGCVLIYLSIYLYATDGDTGGEEEGKEVEPYQRETYSTLRKIQHYTID